MMRKLTITGSDIDGIEEISELIVGCRVAAQEEIVLRLERIADILIKNVEKFNLEEDDEQLADFSRNIAAEVMSDAARERNFPHKAWSNSPFRNFPPFLEKSGNNNSPLSEIFDVFQRRKRMCGMLVYTLQNDPDLAEDARALLDGLEAGYMVGAQAS